MGGSSGGGSGSSSSETAVRFAGYIEKYHERFLEKTYIWRDKTIANNPYRSYNDVPIGPGFFGVGQDLADHTYLYKTFYDAILNFDVEALWNSLIQSTINLQYVDSMVAAESALMENEIQGTILPKFMAGMRDINAVVSSSFVVGKALIYDNKQKLLNKYSADLKFKLIAIVQDKWKTRLAWNSDLMRQHIEIIDTYFTVKNNVRRLNIEVAAKKALWVLDVLDYERANLGALTGATKQSSSTSSGGAVSKTSAAFGGALSGAAAGAMLGSVVPGIGSAVGAAGGAVLGGLAGLF